MLRALLETDVSTFHKLEIHAGIGKLEINFIYSLILKGLNISEVINFFDEVNEHAERIKRYFSTSKCVPQLTV